MSVMNTSDKLSKSLESGDSVNARSSADNCKAFNEAGVRWPICCKAIKRAGNLTIGVEPVKLFVRTTSVVYALCYTPDIKVGKQTYLGKRGKIRDHQVESGIHTHWLNFKEIFEFDPNLVAITMELHLPHLQCTGDNN